MAIKKYTNGSWVPASYRKYGTETDTITTLPATVIGDGTPISSYTIKGNMKQSGTPTPENPIMPSECGERTENLFDVSKIKEGRTINGGTVSIEGNKIHITTSSQSSNTPDAKPSTLNDLTNGLLEVGKTYNIRLVSTSFAYVYLQEANTLWRSNNSLTITQQMLDSQLRWYANSTQSSATIKDLMIYDANEIIDHYIPYGYKLPLTLGSTTTDIYLGEVQSTRRVKKLVLTGTENWTKFESSGAITFYINVSDGTGIDCLSTHFIVTKIPGGLPRNGCVLYNGNTNKNMLFRMGDDTTITDVESFKSFLVTQYAAGMPVTVWYVLEEPETAVVNEPIRKIGDYVDSVSGTNLATSGTAQEFDIGTTLKPSEVDLTYHGWHKHDDTKYST